MNPFLNWETTIVEEEVSADGSVLMVDRRAKLNVDAPYLLKKMMGVEFLLFRQRNTKDLRARELRIEAWNESFDTRVEINEYCVYRYINMKSQAISFFVLLLVLIFEM